MTGSAPREYFTVRPWNCFTDFPLTNATKQHGKKLDLGSPSISISNGIINCLKTKECSFSDLSLYILYTNTYSYTH